MVSNATGARPHSGAIAKAVVKFAKRDEPGGKDCCIRVRVGVSICMLQVHKILSGEHPLGGGDSENRVVDSRFDASR